MNNGEIKYFGYVYNSNGSYKYKIDSDEIIWPKTFTEKGMIPQSYIVVNKEVVTINESIVIFISILSLLSILITILIICFH